jgi:hypothetical protein
MKVIPEIGLSESVNFLLAPLVTGLGTMVLLCPINGKRAYDS